jgi:hypothetical protein
VTVYQTCNIMYISNREQYGSIEWSDVVRDRRGVGHNGIHQQPRFLIAVFDRNTERWIGVST